MKNHHFSVVFLWLMDGWTDGWIDGWDGWASSAVHHTLEAACHEGRLAEAAHEVTRPAVGILGDPDGSSRIRQWRQYVKIRGSLNFMNRNFYHLDILGTQFSEFSIFLHLIV